MNICDQLQPPANSISGWMLGQLSLSNDAVAQTGTEKVVAFAIRLLFVTPLLTACAAADLSFWALKTICIYPVYLSGALNHLIAFIQFIAVPILVLMSAISNRPKTPQPQPPKAIATATPPAFRSIPASPSQDLPPSQLILKATLISEPTLPPPPPKIENPELATAIEALDVESVRKLLKDNADPNSSNGKSPLSILTQIRPSDDIDEMPKRLAISNLLLDSGAQINRLDEFGRSPLGRAAATHLLDLAKLFILRGADTNLADNDLLRGTPLCHALTHNHINPEDFEEKIFSMVELLLNNHVDPNKKISGLLPLNATIKYLPKVSKLLVEKGANLFLDDETKLTPLFSISSQHSQALFKFMAAKLLDPAQDPDRIIPEGKLRGCSPRALLITITSSEQKEFFEEIRTAATPIDTTVLTNVWKLLRKTSTEYMLYSEKALIARMKKISDYSDTSQCFQDPYFQAITATFSQNRTALHNGKVLAEWRRWIHKVSSDAVTKTTNTIFHTFETINPDMSKDLCRLIASYAQLEPDGR